MSAKEWWSMPDTDQDFMFRAYVGLGLTRRNSHVILTGITDGPGPTPLNLGRLYTRHMLGVIMAERDRRRYR